MTVTVVVADFLAGDAPGSIRHAVDFAEERGAAFVAFDVLDGDDDTPDAWLGDRRVGKLAKAASEAGRAGVGLALRLRDTLAIGGLRASLGVAAGTPTPPLRERVLVIVDSDRKGKRLRREATELPSAYELEVPGVKRRGLLRFTPPNYQRATADCDDLVVPWGRIAQEKLVTRIAPDLAKRGAGLWLSEVPERELDRAKALPVAGLIVRFAFAGS